MVIRSAQKKGGNSAGFKPTRTNEKLKNRSKNHEIFKKRFNLVIMR